MIIETFDELVKLLRDNGYIVNVDLEYKYRIELFIKSKTHNIYSKLSKKKRNQEYRFAQVLGKNIRGGFATKSKHVYSYINNKISVDHVDCFDKWSKCPLRMSIPLNGDILIEYLEILRSEEGFDNSNSYDYINNDLYPYKGESI